MKKEKKYLILFLLIISFLLFVFKAKTLLAKEDNYFKLGEQFYFDKNFEIAKTFFLKALTSDSTNYKIYYYLGNIYFIEKEYEKAIETYLDGLKFKKDEKNFYYNIAACYHALEQFDKAIEYYNKSISLDNSFASAYLNLGIVYFDLKDKNNSILNFQKYVQYSKNEEKKNKVLALISAMQKDDFTFPEKQIASNNSSNNKDQEQSSNNDNQNQEDQNNVNSLLDDILEQAGSADIEQPAGEETENEEDI